MPPCRPLPATLDSEDIVMRSLIVALAAVAALATAGTAVAQDYRIPYGDLNLQSGDGAAQLDRRITRAARNACNRMGPLASMQCIVRFRSEAMRGLPETSRQDYARSRGNRVLAMVPVVYG